LYSILYTGFELRPYGNAKTIRQTIQKILDTVNGGLAKPATVYLGISPTFVSPLSFIASATSTFHLNTVSEELIVVSIISSLDTKKASGTDNIPVKIHPLLFGRLVVRVINHSITSGTFPELWKHGMVTPIQKSKGSMELTNF